jgi:pimeloyl-ACP methyl ester carboxylesterase
MKKAEHDVAGESVKYGAFIQVANLKVHVWEMGSGYPIVFIHGFTGTANDWRFNLPELAKNFSVHAFDLPGFGYSQKPLDFKYDADGYSDFVISFLNERGIDKAVLVGNSLGGHVAFNTCTRYPDRVSGLVLIDSGGYPKSKSFLLFNLMKMPVLGNIVMQFISRSSIRQVLKNTILYDASFATEEAISDYYNVYLTTNSRKTPPIIVRNMTADEQRTPELVKQVKCPTLIMWGEQDKVIPKYWSDCFNRDIADSSLSIIPEAGHMPQVEQSGIVNKAIADFVGKVH